MSTKRKIASQKKGKARAKSSDEAAGPTEKDIVEALVGESTKVTAEELQTLFGNQLDGIRATARLVKTTRSRGKSKGRVLILPGIMGSKLGRKRLLIDDVIWLGLNDVIFGNLRDLAMGADPRIVPLGVFLSAYFHLKLTLEIAGYDVDYHPFDWRQNIATLGAELKKTVEREATPVALVAHSMGGLVARAAFLQGMNNVSKLIMLGTPNHGSLAPVEALRGQYGLAKIIAGADIPNSSEDLASKVFSTFPGLYEMILQPTFHARADLFDSQNWPQTGPLPNKTVLKNAANVATRLALPTATPTIPWFLIAGMNQPTKLVAELRNDEFRYEVGPQGDGTVPLDSALLDGVKTWFVTEKHGSLPGNSDVRHAVLDLLSKGETDTIARTPSINRQRSVQYVTEADQRALSRNRSRLAAGPISEWDLVQRIFNEKEPMDTASAPVRPPTGPVHRLEGVSIGRKRLRRIEIALYQGSITDVEARAYVLSPFSGVTPQGAAISVDNLMKGAIASLSKHNMFGARQGEVFILPTGRHPIRADFVVFAGLGTFDQFTLMPSPVDAADGMLPYIEDHYVPAVETAAENAARTLASANIEDFATVFMGGSVTPDLRACGESMLRGFIRGLNDADQGQNVRRVVICELNPARYQHIREHLLQLATTKLCESLEFIFTELEPPPEIERMRALGISTTGMTPSRPPEPAYLLIRREPLPVATVKRPPIDRWTFSLLPPTGRAAVRVEQKDILVSEVSSLLQIVSHAAAPHPGQIDLLSRNVTSILPVSIQSEIAALKKTEALVILHDAAASNIPWETLAINGQTPAMNPGLSRRFLALADSCGGWKDAHSPSDRISMLIVSDPTGDLPGAKEEETKIQAVLGNDRRFSVDTLSGNDATRATILKRLATGRYTVVHYCGHAFFDEKRPEVSGLICASDEVLTGRDLATLPRLPFLFFLNGCQSGRIRTKKVQAAKRPEVAGTGVSAAESLLRCGIPNFIGTYWPVGDDSATDFAVTFYKLLLRESRSLGETISAARNAIKTSPDRLDYMLYGNPNASLGGDAPSVS